MNKYFDDILAHPHIEIIDLKKYQVYHLSNKKGEIVFNSRIKKLYFRIGGKEREIKDQKEIDKFYDCINREPLYK